MTVKGGEDPRPGFEVIPLDLSRVPDVDSALVEAAERDRALTNFAQGSLAAGEGSVLLMAHLPLMSFVNRAVSLHRGVVAAVQAENGHAAFTLLRAQLELAVLIRYVDIHPEYLEELKKPKPEGKRKKFWELFADAATEMAGVRSVYETLSEMAHFGSTALWHPFRVGGESDRTLSWSSYPGWKHDDEPRVVLGMLAEADDAVLEVLGRFDEHHVRPVLRRFESTHAVREALIESGLMDADDVVDIQLAESAYNAGLLRWCEEHGGLEPVDGVTAADIGTWAAETRAGSNSPGDG